MLERIPLQDVPLNKKEPSWMANFKAGEFNQGSKLLHFRLLEPETNGNAVYPLVIWLHGVKGRGDDNHRQLTAGNSHAPAFFGNATTQSKFPAFVLVPQCPGGKYWINFTSNRIRRPLKRVMSLVEHLMATLPIDATRIYVGGQSMGGFATWALLAEHPRLFAAGIPVSGGGSPRKAKKTIAAPVWIFHGGSDPIVKVARSQEMANALQQAEKPFKYTEFPNGRHDIWPLVFQEPDLAEWLFACKTAVVKRKR